MSLLHKYHQFHLLSEFLKKENLPDAYPIYFREESDADNRYALGVSIHPRNGHPELLGKLAVFFGCPADELPNPEDDSFEASDDWHGGANGDLRDLAYEMAKDLGEGFFDTDYTVGQIHARGTMLKELQRADAKAEEAKPAETFRQVYCISPHYRRVTVCNGIQETGQLLATTTYPGAPSRQFPGPVEKLPGNRRERYDLIAAFLTERDLVPPPYHPDAAELKALAKGIARDKQIAQDILALGGGVRDVAAALGVPEEDARFFCS